MNEKDLAEIQRIPSLMSAGMGKYGTLITGPLSAYFIYLGGRFQANQIIYVLLALVIGLLVAQLPISIWRKRIFTRLVQELKEQRDNAGTFLKVKLINFTKTEALLTLVTWVLTSLAVLISFAFTTGLSKSLVYAIVAMFIFNLPYSIALHGTIIEKILLLYFDKPFLRDVRLDISSVTNVLINEKSRNTLLLYASSILPIIMLGFLLVQENSSSFVLSNIVIHLFIIIFFTVCIVAAISYETYKLEELLYGKILNVLGDLEKGVISENSLNLSGSIEMISLSEDLNRFISVFKEAVQEISLSSNSVALGSEQINSSSGSIAASSSEQAAHVEETTASIQEITGKVTETARRSNETLAASEKLVADSTAGKQFLLQAIHDIREVAQKILLVEEVARQTTLLSLNASIEAVRAGEHGRGFSVVAAEIGKLAERSREAASDIISLTQSTLNVSEKVEQIFEIILPRVQENGELFRSIMEFSEQEKMTMTQVNTAMERLNNIAQNNAQSSETLAASTGDMHHHVKTLAQDISFFQFANK